jgi:uncharacterized protein involved in type VI secretion and phage assembly
MHAALEELLHARAPQGYGGRFYGVYSALVTDIADPDGQGRVRVRLPWSPDTGDASYEAWARLVTLMGGADRGTWFVPDVEDEVLVVFEGGDARRPYVLGGLWNGTDAPPEAMDSGGENNLKVIKSRNGVTVTLDDTQGSERLALTTPGGQSLTLADGPGRIELADSNGNTVELSSSGITITASAKVSVTASQVEVSAGMVSVSAGMSRFSGVVQSDTNITNSTVSSSQTPCAGSIW